jgi:predicted nucleotidyltransferase
MTTEERPLSEILAALNERAKELNCLYRVDDVLGRRDITTADALREIVDVLPPGWQYPEICQARIEHAGEAYSTPGYRETEWLQVAPLLLRDRPVGEIRVGYTEARPPRHEGPFLEEERRLLATLAKRIGQFLESREEGTRFTETEASGRSWTVILDFLRQTDRALLRRITRKMINHLCWHGVAEAQSLLRDFVPGLPDRDEEPAYENRPSARHELMEMGYLVERTFGIAARHLSEAEIIQRTQQWINEDKTGNLAAALERMDSSLSEVEDALGKYAQMEVEEGQLPESVKSQLRVALLRRFFSERLEFLDAARDYVQVSDFNALVQRIVAPTRSWGKLGGKSAGLFLAMKVLEASAASVPVLAGVRSPRTWYVSSDALLDFIRYNDLDDLYNRKYLEIDQVRQDYPHITQLFKNSRFPPEITKGLSVALDEFEDSPLIVRSSSLLEDQSGAAFSGKYRSLFLANQGTKRQRLEALQDAIAEVYASIFGPDPIEYRAERGLLDVHEEMGIMIQEVVGRRVGSYFFPAFSGVAFSNNEFRWSPRIRRTDGLLRLVPGLGTRAVDRLSDDYPVLVSPGQPGLRVNTTADEIVRYSPAQADVINLKTGQFETVDVAALLADCGRDWPAVHRIVSRWKDGRLSRPLAIGPDYRNDSYVVTFDGLFSETPFLERMQEMLKVLRDALGFPVDLEFAADGEDLYLVQCRAQSYAPEAAPAAIPPDLPRGRVLFSAHRHVSNGRALNLTHVVYVDADAYDRAADRDVLLRVARAVGALNRTLPKRQFLLMGPGRWGSRGDIKLGVAVTYSDISNTAVLSEVARKKGRYSPDLSFGTHFFQDLVEAGIRYLPLYPDEEGNRFDHLFLERSHNLLPELLPEFADVAEIVRVIDVVQATGGRVLHVLMNADLDEAVGIFADAEEASGAEPPAEPSTDYLSEDHWRWREFMAEQLAAAADREALGIRQIYVFGSTKNGTAGPASDLDLLVHFRGDDAQRARLDLWLEGWSRALAAMNYLRTGYRSEGLLDVHVLTDADIEERTSFALKIDAVTDAARPLPESPSGA